MRGVEADIEALRKNHEIRMAELYKAAGLKPPRASRAEMQVGRVRFVANPCMTRGVPRPRFPSAQKVAA